MKTIYKTLLSWIKSDTNFADYKLSSDALRLVKWKNHETKDLDLSLDDRLKLVKVINKRAFQGCSNLTSIIIPSGVTSIESEAFKGCSSLTSISIPDSVTSIEESAFEGCSSLTSVVFEGDCPPEAPEISNVFCGTSSSIKVIVPKGAKDAYIASGYPADKIAEDCEY